MAKRPVFIASNATPYFMEKNIEFEFYSGFSLQQKQKSIESLHKTIVRENPNANILEISSSSHKLLGKKLSAFNLTYKLLDGTNVTVESAFQSSKVFEHTGPYTDLLMKPSIIAKKDPRIRESGKIVGFKFLGIEYPSEPKTFFYDWIYINALAQHEELHDELMQFNAFTDIEFNPQKSLNCQARSTAIFVSLKKEGNLESALNDMETFKNLLYANDFMSNVGAQISLFD